MRTTLYPTNNTTDRFLQSYARGSGQRNHFPLRMNIKGSADNEISYNSVPKKKNGKMAACNISCDVNQIRHRPNPEKTLFTSKKKKADRFGNYENITTSFEARETSNDFKMELWWRSIDALSQTDIEHKEFRLPHLDDPLVSHPTSVPLNSSTDNVAMRRSTKTCGYDEDMNYDVNLNENTFDNEYKNDTQSELSSELNDIVRISPETQRLLQRKQLVQSLITYEKPQPVCAPPKKCLNRPKSSRDESCLTTPRISPRRHSDGNITKYHNNHGGYLLMSEYKI